MGEWKYGSTINELGGTSTINELGGEWSASCPGHFIFGERAPSFHWTKGWVGPKASLNVKMRKISCLCLQLKSEPTNL
jgi:hypothetical protein